MSKGSGAAGTRKASAAARQAQGWTRRWLRSVEALGFALSPGSPAVSIVEMAEAGVRGEIGSGDDVVDATIALRPFPARVFDRAIQVMAGRASFAASLLSGRIPEDVDEAFAGTSHTLLPKSPDELVQRCHRCESEAERDSVLCLHLSALHRALDSRLADDPFLVFLLRGKGRGELLAELSRHRATATDPPPRATTSASHAAPREALPELVPSRAESFFKAGVPISQLKTGFTPPEHPEAVLTRLGPPPLTDPEAVSLLSELHRAIGIGAAERLEEWEWRRIGERGRSG